MSEPPGKGEAFIKGGCGCLVLFAVIGLLVAVAGGRAHANLGGLLFLFVIGGVIGLVALMIYNRGRHDGDGK